MSPLSQRLWLRASGVQRIKFFPSARPPPFQRFSSSDVQTPKSPAENTTSTSGPDTKSRPMVSVIGLRNKSEVAVEEHVLGIDLSELTPERRSEKLDRLGKQSVSASRDSSKKVLQGDVAPRARLSPVHDQLFDIYEVDGEIPGGKESTDRVTDTFMPKWGSWGVLLKFRAYAGSETVELPNFWLRDSCLCPRCVNQDTMQRGFDTFSIPRDVMPTKVVTAKAGLLITWNHENHESLYTWDWIRRHRNAEGASIIDSKGLPIEEKDRIILWGAEIAENPPSIHYDQIMTDDSWVGQWTENIRKYGFCYVDGCPVSPAKTEKLLERIAFIRITHYGILHIPQCKHALTNLGGFYDFTSDLTMKDTAYTSLALPAHTDTTYFSDPAGLQMFHLLSHTDGTGGKSLLVDGFNAALQLQKEDERACRALCDKDLSFHASGNEGITIMPARKFPVLTLKQRQEGKLTAWRRGVPFEQVRWNNDDRGVPVLDGKMTAEQWYTAARKFDQILKRKDMEYWAQLEPGRPLIFDNWRVLHGRSAFTGKRRICGGYINRDDYISRWRNTNFSREEALQQVL
ncbi:hypothetical protein BJ875DRAFT_455614 [Amylocarpus encephaloides]|uniref:trimethyllysine dioxygenase n=1 Tax=Amylocarpus encephaloides TaxID=45428 RepID=A0A9P7YND2_9HELO|nr:hypothetical protein BJ875DRAFT_455614 [Amylocarpus encephaloides]